VKEIRSFVPFYTHMLLENLEGIIARYNKNPEYPFIDTKLDLISGEDLSFVTSGVDLFGKDTIYSWIQGRGLEALCACSDWLESVESLSTEAKKDYQDSIREMARSVVMKMEEFRQENNGRLFFSMDREGNAFEIDNGRKVTLDLPPTESSTSDLFYAKGLCSTARFLRDPELMKEAEKCYQRIVTNIREQRFASDKRSFDPKVQAGPVDGRFPHGPFMLAIDMCTLFASDSHDPTYIQDGISFIKYILDHHVIHEDTSRLKQFDFTEFIDGDHNPYCTDGHVISDMGHAFEFVGHALKFLRSIESRSLSSDEARYVDEAKKIIPEVLFHNFPLGFNGKGICKTYSLTSRRPLNADMPWWSLPEAICASMLAYEVVADAGRQQEARDILLACLTAFQTYYVNPDVYSMAFQTISSEGTPVRVIPATPDADPLYHTGRCMIVWLDLMKNHQGEA
jgi:N-acylglucosamine 2-epimerase (GlcNAc 2-epimerase)